MESNVECRTGRHVVTSIHAHLVFVTKFRRGVFDQGAIARLRETFDKVSADVGARMVECDGEDDHVHLLIEYPPTVALSRLVNSLKGVGSRSLMRDRADIRRRCAKGLRSPSYFAASCGGAPPDIVRAYVRNQRQEAGRALSLPDLKDEASRAFG